MTFEKVRLLGLVLLCAAGGFALMVVMVLSFGLTFAAA